jgi:hypothetical protein
VSRILADDDWYDPLAASSLYEKEFNAVVRSHAFRLFADYHVVPFDVLVQSDERDARPDLALIDKRYRSWWVVEIEMAHHSLYGHVIPQVETLSRARYGGTEAEKLRRHDASLDEASVLDMMKGQQPRVLVILNSPMPDWAAPLAVYRALLGVVQLFRSDRNKHLLLTSGDYPSLPANLVSLCHLDPAVPFLLLLHSPAGLAIKSDDIVQIRFQGGVTFWQRLDAADRAWLRPLGANPLEPKLRYVIVRGDDGSLYLEEAPQGV